MANSRAKRPRLSPIAGGKGVKSESPVESLLSGRVQQRPQKTLGKRTEIPPQGIPETLAEMSNLYAAARALLKEIQFKADFAEQKVKDYCVRDYVHHFVLIDRKPPNIDYAADHSRFKFVMTARTTLTPEKADFLRSLKIPIEKHTELRGLRVNYDAIKQHGLENKLREALESMNLSKGVLDECLVPEVQLKGTFYDRLLDIVRESLSPHEELEAKTYEVLSALGPANQVRNMEVVDLSARQCFDLIEKTEITPEEDVA